jgi:hypothetical protein
MTIRTHSNLNIPRPPPKQAGVRFQDQPHANNFEETEIA